MDTGDIVMLLGAMGGGYIIPKTLGAVLDSIKGQAKRRADALQERDEAQRARDEEARKRRLLEETLHSHRRICHEQHNMAYKAMPPWPRTG